MKNFETYLTEVRNGTHSTNIRQLRHCKADILEYPPYYGYSVDVLRSYWTNVCIKRDNLYLVSDKHCTSTTWQHVNKFIQDTRTQSKGAIICYMDDTRTDKVYIKYIYNRKTVTIRKKDIIEFIDTDYLSCLYYSMARALRKALPLLNYGRTMTPHDYEILKEEITEWFGLY